MEESPKISVIMSVYKEPVEWLKQSIDSILNQTFKDFEFIIICDNPQYDEGIALLNEYAAKNNCVRLIYNKDNFGLTKSLNKGLDVAKGEYIARMDADDISLPYRLEEQWNFMKVHPNCVVSGGFARIIDERGRKKGYWKTKCSWKDLKSCSLFVSPILHPTAFFKRLNKEGKVRYDENMKYAQDYALWGSMIGENEILNNDKILLYYRQTYNQISANHYEEQARCAIQTQSVLFDELKLLYTTEIKKVIAIVTKKSQENCDIPYIYKSLISFVQGNTKNENINMPVFKRMLYNCFGQYLRFHASLLEANKYILLFSKATGVFELRTYLVMNWCLLRKSVNI